MRRPALAALALLAAIPALAAEEPPPDDGRALYFGASARPIAASIAGVPQRPLACAQCHGRDAAGLKEGGQRTPAIDRAALVSGAYDRDGFARALVDGVAPDGRRLSLAMPRFAASAERIDALWRFLDGAAARDRAGVAPDGVMIVVMHTGDDVGRAEALRAALERRATSRFGRVTRFGTRNVAAGVEALSGYFLGVWAGSARDDNAFAAAAAAGLPVLAARAPDVTPADVVRLAASSSDVETKLRALAGEGALTLARLPEAGPGARVAVSEEALTADPALAARIAATGAALVVARPAGEPADAEAYASALAAVIETGLERAGRALSRRRFLEALAETRIAAKDWPALAFGSTNRQGATEVSTR